MNKYRLIINGMNEDSDVKKISKVLKSDFSDIDISLKSKTISLTSDLDYDQVFIKVNKLFKLANLELSVQKKKKKDYKLIRLIVTSILFIISFVTPNIIWIYIFIYLLIGYDILFSSCKNIIKGQIFDEYLLMSIATLGSFIIGSYKEAVAVMLFFQIGEYIGDISNQKSHNSLLNLLNLKADYANVGVNNKLKRVDVSKVKVNDIVIVKKGEKIPLDGVIVEGVSFLDTSSLTGEAMPVEVKKNDVVLGGMINLENVLKIKVTKKDSQTVASKIISKLSEIENNKTSSEKFITRFSKIYTPIVVIIGLLIVIIPTILFKKSFTKYLYKSFIFLAVSCPCALVLSVPLSFVVGIGAASKIGILVKSGEILEKIPKIKAIYFDKTGTITEGKIQVSSIVTSEDISSKRVMEYAKACEYYSTHPIAKAITNYTDIKIDEKELKRYKEYAGKGVSATYQKQKLAVGNYEFMKKLKIDVPTPRLASTVVYVARDNTYLGYLIIEDKIRVNTKDTLNNLRLRGITNLGILSGDNEHVVMQVAKMLGVNNYKGALLPEDKSDIISASERKYPTMFIGDGINDALVLKTATIGVSLGRIGSDVAVESSDIVIMNDDISKLTSLFTIAEKTKKIVYFNVAFAIIVKIVVLLLGLFSNISIWLAVFADVGVTIITVLNTLYIGYNKKKG